MTRPSAISMYCGNLGEGICSQCLQMHGRSAGYWLVTLFANEAVWWQGRCVTDDFGNLVQVSA